ncbi:MAG: isochorismatase family protein, partial [Pseudomonadales bacterium]|nr:isochorismatase family protein [Pseudomonadales bacterium]
MNAVLITQCIQNDFVKLLASGEPLPNLLHIGHDEAQRLVGSDVSAGPIGCFMRWVNRQPSSNLNTIHVRDWHNGDSPEQEAHLAQFGPHCIQNTSGAEFIFDEINEDATLINSTTLNDFEGTGLKETLDAIVSQCSSGDKIRVGLVGVWTEAKIMFLAYELTTRYSQFEVAVCSALTASSSRSQHFLALQQLSRVVGVTVIDSMGEFTQFLSGREGALEEPILQHKGISDSLEIVSDKAMHLDEEAENLIRYLFRDCQKISLKVLDGGFSGNLVAGVQSFDVHGHEQAPHVVKIGPRSEMAQERTAFEQIEGVLGNNAPAISEYADMQRRGAIKYRYASMGTGKARSLQECFQTNVGQEKLHSYLDAIFSEQMGRLYRASVRDTQDLLKYYCFDSEWADSVRNKIVELIGDCSESGELVLPGNKSAYNLYRFYKEELDKLPSTVADYPFSFIHGDLNGANVIIDERDNVWLIDFFHTQRGHVLKDFAKLENDLLYIYTPIEGEEDLMLAYEFTDFLLGMDDPYLQLPELPEVFIYTQFESTYQSICKIRSLAANQISNNDAKCMLQWLVPQLRYAVHTIGFDEPNEWQRAVSYTHLTL